MNQLSIEKRVQIVSALVEGYSIRSIVRMTGCSKNTIAKLLVELGAACSNFMREKQVNLGCKRVQCDEIWSFVAAKQKNVTPEMAEENPHAGDVWTWIAMDADTKLIVTWVVGNRDWYTAQYFINDLQSRLANRVQLTTDGLKLYFHAISASFAENIDYAIVRKIFGGTVDESGPERKYSPSKCIGCERKNVIGDPDPEHISTSYVERQNLTLRLANRRFTRLTNAFSKKIENHIASIAIHYAFYNFCRIHQSLRITPAMAAGLTDHVWEIEELLNLLSVGR